MSPQRVSIAPSRAGRPPAATASSRRRLALALGVILLVAWTQVFLGIHELSHLGQANASSCPMALLAATQGGGSLHAPFSLHAPLAEAAEHFAIPRQACLGPAPVHQARSPPQPA